MKHEIDWESIPENEFESYKKRLEIVELILDGSIDSETKKRLRRGEHTHGSQLCKPISGEGAPRVIVLSSPA